MVTSEKTNVKLLIKSLILNIKWSSFPRVKQIYIIYPIKKISEWTSVSLAIATHGQYNFIASVEK